MANKTINNLQITRGIATIAIVVAHSTMFIGEHIFYGIFAIGRCAVDLFFIVSGFIIYYTNQKLIGNFSLLSQYLLRRLVRVYPVHWICLFIILSVCYSLVKINAFSYYFDWKLIWKSAILWPTYSEGLPTNPVAWTLSYEVFFYIFFGLCVVVGKRFLKISFFLWFLTTLVSLKYDVKNNFLHMFTNTKNIEFIYGCMMGIYINKINFNKKTYFGIFSLGILLVTASWYYVWDRSFIEDARFDFIFSGIPCALIVYSLIKLENRYSSKIKSIFIFFGDASYSIYLNHFILINFLYYFLHKFIPGKIAMFALTNSVSLLFGVLFYLLIEKPLTVYLRKWVDRLFKPNTNAKVQIVEAQVAPIEIK